MRKVFIVMLAVFALTTLSLAQTAIYDIQHVDDPATSDVSPLNGQTVTVHGWITFEPMSMGGNKFFVADAAGAWNGIYVYTGDNDYNLGFGWEVEVTGTVTEYISNGYDFGITEIDASAGTVSVISDVVDWAELPDACAYTTVSAADLAGGQASAEMYESVLVNVETVTTSNDDAGYGEWEVSDANGNSFLIDNPQDEDFGYIHDVEMGLNFDYIRGALNYSYGAYKIVPEIAFDLKVTEDIANGIYTPIAWLQQVRPMDMTIREDDEGGLYTNDASMASLIRYDEEWEDTTFVTLHGLVTMPTGLSNAGAGVKFIMSDFDHRDNDGSTRPWNAILSYDPDSTVFPTLYIGDEIIARGYIDEYQTGPGNMTEFWNTETANFVSAGNEMPTPAVVNTADIRDPRYGERWGNVMVTVEDALVSNNELEYEMFTIDDDINDEILGINVDDDSYSIRGYDIPPLGTNIESITGWIYHHYGSYDPEIEDWAYKLCPLYEDQIIIGEGPPNIMTCNRTPAAPGPDEAVVVSAQISDNSSVEYATLYWKHEADENWTSIDMLNTEGIVWEATIPAQTEGSDVWYYIEAADDMNTTSPWPGTPGEDAVGYWAVSELTTYHIQYTPFASGRSPYDGSLVTVSGVITTGPAVNNTHGAYFLQSGDSYNYSGLCVLIPAAVGTPAIGDLVTVTGSIDESGVEYNYKWGGNTRMISTVVCTIDQNEVDYTTYQVDAATVNASLEAYESVMVEFTNLTIMSTNDYDWTFVDDSGESFLLDDDFSSETDFDAYYNQIMNGSTISSVRGVITYSFGTWKVESRDLDDLGDLGVDDNFENNLPVNFALEQNYPNPFNPTTNINYSIPTNTRVQVLVYNSLGQLVRTLIDAPQSAGNYSIYWNGLNEYGSQVTSGTYFLRLVADGNQIVRQMTLVK